MEPQTQQTPPIYTQPVQPTPPIPPAQVPVRPLSVVGLILAFLIPPAGLIISIVVLAKKLLGANKTLGILGVVFGALNTFCLLFIVSIVIVTFVGVQERARDSATQTTARVIQKQADAYWDETGSYPSSEQVRSAAWLKQNFTGIDDDAVNAYLADGKISYETTPANCQNLASSPCDEYTITIKLSKGPTQIKSDSYESDYYEYDSESDD